MNHELWVVALSESVSRPGTYALILEDAGTRQRIPVLIGASEAQAIAMPLEKMTSVRPQTHDLLSTVILSLNATLREVLIREIRDDIFYASIFLQTAGGIVEIDARPSDAIALAVRMGAPLRATETVVSQASYMTEERSRDKKGSYAQYTIEELEEILKKTLGKEDYESAVRVREAIERKRGEQGTNKREE